MATKLRNFFNPKADGGKKENTTDWWPRLVEDVVGLPRQAHLNFRRFSHIGYNYVFKRSLIYLHFGPQDTFRCYTMYTQKVNVSCLLWILNEWYTVKSTYKGPVYKEHPVIRNWISRPIFTKDLVHHTLKRTPVVRNIFSWSRFLISRFY